MFDEKAIVFEDKRLLVVNKPSGMLTVPTPKKEKHTLTSCIKNIFEERGLHIEIFPCHRLDREASGLIIYAKNRDIQHKIMSQFKNGQVRKKYIAFIDGLIKKPKGTISFAIENKRAITKYKLLQRRKYYSIIEVEPSTGRTNQIRIHFKMVGHPLLGERRFAFGKDFKIKFRRLALHASEIQFRHPLSDKVLTISLRLPDDMNRLIGSLMKPKCME
ncbi:MAG: RluA family pseudouridine synthase [Candidatus Omnitrophica bacterium]|nr:RluA family pseudouridine synthase [Candidatus Omnitrophota bacterium]